MPPTYRSASSASATAGTTLPINVPSGTANGDILFLGLSNTNGVAPSAPAGWTSLNVRSGSMYSQLFYRVAASEPASYTFTGWPSNYNRAACIVGYSNASSVLNGASGTASSTATSPAPAAVPGLVAGDLRVSFFAYSTSAVAAAAGQMTGGTTERVTVPVTNDGFGLYLHIRFNDSDASITHPTVSASNAGSWGMHSAGAVSLQPDSGGFFF